jgi:hypothetical protein
MRYMMFIKHTEDYRGKPVPPALMKAMGEFVMPHLKSGKFIEAAGLMSTWRGKKVQLRGGRVSVIDGPFTESKELIAGFWLWQVKSMDEAVAWIKKAPFGGGVVIELRQVFETEDFGDALPADMKESEDRMRMSSTLAEKK